MPDIFEQTTHVVRFRNCEAKYSCASHFAHFIKKFFKLSILPANTRSSVKICSHNLSAIQLRCLVWAFQTIYREIPCVVDERKKILHSFFDQEDDALYLLEPA